MLTPAFELRQDAVYLTIIIKARYAKVTETEVFVDGTDFKFYAKPYFLRLNLPGRLVEDGREKASYDVENGTFTIRVAKETPGEEFQGLDLLTTLLAPKGQTSATEPGIQVIAGNAETSEKEEEVAGGGGEEEEGEEEDFDWQVNQQPFVDSEEGIGLPSGTPRYGFANRRSGVFKRLRDELCGVVDIQHADEVSLPERKRVRIEAESDKFDDGHYLADLFQDEAIRTLLQFKPPWVHNYKKMRERVVESGNAASNQSSAPEMEFTDEEKELMLKLPRKEFILSNNEKKGALLGMADILFAYAYNKRTLEGEKSVESAWTVCKLSSTLSCLDSFCSPQEMVIACCRRALCYPLFRNWDLCRKVLKDVRMILRLGRNQVLKCLFEIHRLLSSDEPRYILNDLYISDYCVWLQTVDNQTLLDLEEQIGKVQLEKKDVGLDLDDLEEAATQVAREEEDAPDQRRNGHHGNSHQHQHLEPHQEEGDVQPVVHQVGYPDLLRRSDVPGPDIATTHVVMGAQTTDLERQNGQGIEYRDNEDDGDEDSDETEDDDDDSEEEEEDSSDEEDGEDGNDCEVEVANDEAELDSERTCPDHLEYSRKARSAQSLESEFVGKVTIASTDADSATPNDFNPGISQSSSAISSRSNCVSHPDRTEHKANRAEQTPSIGFPLEGDGDVEETMNQMLNQLSLEPSASSLSSDHRFLDRHVGHVSDKNESRSADKNVENASDQNGELLTEWLKSPPSKRVEMFDN